MNCTNVFILKYVRNVTLWKELKGYITEQLPLLNFAKLWKQESGWRKAIYLGDEDGIDFGIVFEVLKDLHTFSLRCGSINIWSVEIVHICSYTPKIIYTIVSMFKNTVALQGSSHAYKFAKIWLVTNVAKPKCQIRKIQSIFLAKSYCILPHII